MSGNKTIKTDRNVVEFIKSLDDSVQRDDCMILVDLFAGITGESPRMWGDSIIGFGEYRYRTRGSSQEKGWALIGFSPRKQNLTIYIMNGFSNYTNLLAKLGRFTNSKSCLYIKRLADIDREALAKIIEHSYNEMKTNYPS